MSDWRTKEDITDNDCDYDCDNIKNEGEKKISEMRRE